MLFEITKNVIAEFAIWNQEIQFVFSEARLKGKAQLELLYKLMLFNILYLLFWSSFPTLFQTEMGKSASKYETSASRYFSSVLS